MTRGFLLLMSRARIRVFNFSKKILKVFQMKKIFFISFEKFSNKNFTVWRYFENFSNVKFYI